MTTSTLLAYNDWGGANHYRGIGDDPRVDIGSPVSSTLRPIARGMIRKPAGAPREANPATLPMFAAPQYPAWEWARLHGYSRHHADAYWATYERNFAHWAERNGYELDYLTQHDLHFDPGALDGYRCAVVVGHDEYWSWSMRDTIDAFVDGGGGLARLGGNFGWQVRLSDDGTPAVLLPPALGGSGHRIGAPPGHDLLGGQVPGTAGGGERRTQRPRRRVQPLRRGQPEIIRRIYRLPA